MEVERIIMERLDALGQISDETDRLTRLFASPAMKRANDLVASWMREAGMSTRLDAVGNLIGHLPGPSPDSKIVLMGSHLDTVRNAGKYDGPLGVVLAIACVEQIRRLGKKLPFTLDMIGFADEEGARYQTAYLGSRALTGDLTERDLALLDSHGVSMADAILDFGGDPAKIPACKYPHEQMLGYIEAHIEQGPVLEDKNLAAGIVTAIAGQTRAAITFEGLPGHAGTTPMAMRHDALSGAAEFIVEVEKYAQDCAGLVATVGQIAADPNISNVIPGGCRISLDVRHQEDATRLKARADLEKIANTIAKRRGLQPTFREVQATASVPCSPALSKTLRASVLKFQPHAIELASGAGHDGAVISKISPVAMLFVRCKGGISHHPAESVRAEDVRIALDVLVDFVLSIA